MKEKECSAPFHSKDCPCPGCLRNTCTSCHSTNQDHFTPRCVIKKNHNRFRKGENMQWLSRACHRLKDRSTPMRKYRRVFRTLDDLREWRNKNDLIFKP